MKWLPIWPRPGLEEYFYPEVSTVDNDHWDITEFMLMIYANATFESKEIQSCCE